MSRTEAAAAGGTRPRTKALVVPLAGLGAALFMPPLLPGLPLAGQRALIVTLITILLWTGELLAPGVAALITGVIPPVKSEVDASRLIEESANITALATSAPRGTRPSVKTSS